MYVDIGGQISAGNEKNAERTLLYSGLSGAPNGHSERQQVHLLIKPRTDHIKKKLETAFGTVVMVSFNYSRRYLGPGERRQLTMLLVIVEPRKCGMLS